MQVMHRVWQALLPELGRFPSAQAQAEALEKARRTEFDVFELVGIAFALVVVTSLTQYTLADSAPTSRILAALFNFIVAVPLIGVALAPFHLRRLRRGLRGLSDQPRHGHE